MHAGAVERELEAQHVAAEHPEVGEQVVAEVDRLGALQVRVAGHRPVAVALGELEQALHHAPPAARSPRSECDWTTMPTSVATWSLRERPVWSLPASGPIDLRQPALDRHVDVLVGVVELELAALHLRADLLERRSRAALSSSAVSTPISRSARAWARDWSMS